MDETIKQQKNCPNCGNALEFNPERGELFCSHCGTAAGTISVGELTVDESDLPSQLAGLENDADQTEHLVVNCDNCGAEVAMLPNVTADRCPYCNSPIVAAGHSVRRIRPSAVLPFKLSKEDATGSYRQWLGSRWFMPNRVKHEARMLPLNGVYLPHWTYDARTVATYTGARGEYYYVTVRYTVTENGKTVEKSRQERRTRWYPAFGTVTDHFDDLLVPATRSLPPEIINELTPWDLPQLQPYHEDFIRGFREESYSVSLAEGFGIAKQMMEPEIESSVRRDIGGDEQRIYHLNISYHDLTFKHILLPVWLGSFNYNNRNFLFTVNARTGEVQGKRPWSMIKITCLVLFLAALVAAVIWYFAANS